MVVMVVSAVERLGYEGEFCSGGLGAALLLGAKGREEGGRRQKAPSNEQGFTCLALTKLGIK